MPPEHAPDVKFFDATALHAPLLPALMDACARVHAHGRYLGGPEVDALEARLSERTGTHAIACGSGTTALVMALLALDVRPGDEVVLPAFTFAAPAEAVLLLGATPVFADIEPDTCTLSVTAARAAITPRTRAIVAVSLYGQPADMAALQALADEHDVALVEDAAQSFGARLHGTPSGAFGDIACTSFFPTKPLGGCGDGGAVFTRDPALASILRQIRDHGQSAKYEHHRLGLNGRLDSMACAQLLVKLDRFDEDLARRRTLAAAYDAALPGGLQGPAIRAGAQSAWALYVVRHPCRDALRDALARAGIEAAVHYPSPLHRQRAFADACRHGDLRETERACHEVLCLPLHPALTDAQQARVIEALAGAVPWAHERIPRDHGRLYA